MFEPAFAVTMSGLPSPFRSPARREWGLVPDGVVHGSLKRPVARAAKHTDAVRGVVRDREVGFAVCVEVANHDRVRLTAGAVVDSLLERRVAVAEQHADHASSPARDGEVELAVTVHVADRRLMCVHAGRVLHGAAEGAVAVPLQHADGTRVLVRRDDVGLAVLVEIGYGGRLRLRGRADGEGRPCEERPAAVGLEDRHVVREGVRVDEVELPVTVDIRCDDAVRSRTGRECGRRPERGR